MEDEVLNRIKETVVLDPQMPKREKVARLKEEMLAAAKNMEFEKAALLRDAMQLLESGASLETFETKVLPFSTAGQTRTSAKKSRKGASPGGGTKKGNPTGKSGRKKGTSAKQKGSKNTSS